MKKPEKEPTLLVTRKEAARLLCVTERHLQRQEKEGLFHPVRIGASVRYRRAEIEAVIARLAEGGSQ